MNLMSLMLLLVAVALGAALFFQMKKTQAALVEGGQARIKAESELQGLKERTLKEAEADAIPIDEDEDTEIIVGSSALGLADWVEEEAILSLPIAPRHEDCSAPGFDFSDNPQEELADDRRRPFAVLETLKRSKMN